MKKIILLLTLMTFVILIFISCKKCVQKNLGNVSFTATDLQIVPYKGTETLIFSDSLGDLLTYRGNRHGSNYNDRWVQCPSGDCPGAGGESCSGNYFFTEFYNIQFIQNSNINMQFNLWMDSGNPFNQNFTKYIGISVNFNDIKTWGFGCSFIFNKLQLYNYSKGGGSIVSLNDSLIIGPKKFYSVYVLKQNTPWESFSNLQYVYYSITQGIVGFKEQGGKTWYLSN